MSEPPRLADWRDLLAGLVLCCIGLVAAIFAPLLLENLLSWLQSL